MKKLFGLILAFGLLVQTPVFAADQWDESQVAGTRNASDIDTYMIVNNEALDRLNRYARFGVGVNYATAATLTALTGSIAIPNAAATTIRWRSNTSDATVTWADIDTGAEANSTTYYLYATADTDITGMVFKISASSSAPSGMTYYRKIATFYNDSSGNITNVVSLRTDDGTDYQEVAKGWLNYNGSTNTINDSYNVSSVTDNGTGDFTINWTTSFSTANYVVVGIAGNTADPTSNGGMVTPRSAWTTTSARFQCWSLGAAVQDSIYINLVAFGDR